MAALPAGDAEWEDAPPPFLPFKFGGGNAKKMRIHSKEAKVEKYVEALCSSYMEGAGGRADDIEQRSWYFLPNSSCEKHAPTIAPWLPPPLGFIV